MERTTQQLQALFRAAKKNSLVTLLFLIPLFSVIWWADTKGVDLEQMERHVTVLEKKAIGIKQQNQRQEAIWSRAKKNDTHYLSRVVESLPLLTPERVRVQELYRQYPENPSLRARLNFLQSESNHIRFVPVASRASSFFQETELRLQNRVQMSDADLQRFLPLIEESDGSVEEGRPLLLIKKFHLAKEREKGDETIYTIDTEIIRRAP